MDEDSGGVKEGITQLHRPVKIGRRDGNFVLLKDPKWVGRRVVDVQVSQSKSRLRGFREDNGCGDRTGVVRATLGAIGVDYSELSSGGVKEAGGGEEVKCHDITRVEKPGQEGNSRQKGTINVKGNVRLATSAGEGLMGSAGTSDREPWVGPTGA